MMMIAAVIAGAIDPIKVVLSLILFMSARTKSWSIVCLIAVLLVGYIALAGLMLGRMSAGSVMTHLLSALLLVGIWAALSRWLGLRVTTGLAGAATLACCTAIYLVVAQPSLPTPDTGAEQSKEIAKAPTGQPSSPPKRSPTQPSASNQARETNEYINYDAGIAASLEPSNTSIANQPGEGNGYREVTLEEIQGSR